MRKLILTAGVAAFAMAVPAAAKPDKGGGGHDGHEQAQQGGGGGQKAQRGGGGNRQQQRVERGGGGQRAVQMQRGGGGERRAQRMERRGGDRQMQRMERRGGERQAQRLERRGGGERRFANFQSDRNERRAQRAERRGNDRQMQRVERREQRQAQRIENRNRDVARFDNRGRNNDRIEQRNRVEQRIARQDRDFRRAGQDRDFARVNQETIVRFRDDSRRQAQWRDWGDDDWDRRFGNRGIPASFVGCPPGLAKKSPACIPPGQARNAFVGTALPSYYASNVMPLGLRDLYYDTDDYYYRWGDGYAYRVDRGDNLISALLPLIGAGYGVGQYFPNYNQPSYYVPSYYSSFYPSYGDDYYRYANGYVYEIDGRSGYIEDVIPLLDRGYGMGQMLPAGYSYYNVPYQYRDYYYDTDDYYYRYAPGAIYQVDRSNQLITAVASLLTGGLAVGQPLPPAYSTYNVPYSYRTTYFDRPDAWYRYSDGYIYQVDPTTQLITAIVRSIV